MPAPVASKVRFLPHSPHPRTVCMRVEVYGCPYTSPVLAYSAPPGDQFSPALPLQDLLDGGEGEEQGGLGLLTDGLTGENLTLHDQDTVAGNTQHLIK